MSNPYESPTVSVAPNYSPLKPEDIDRRFPGVLLATLIVISVIAGFGLFNSLISIGIMTFQEMTSSTNAAPNDVYEVFERNLLGQWVMDGVNLIVAPLILAGTLGMFLRQKWSPGVLYFGLIVGLMNLLLNLILDSWMQWNNYQMMKRAMVENQGEGSVEMMTGLSIFLVVAIGFAIGTLVLQAALYLFALLSLKFEKNQRFFATFGD